MPAYKFEFRADRVYRAGCVGPNGAAVVHKRPPPPKTVTCANGVYHAGCVEPNGTAVIQNIRRFPGAADWSLMHDAAPEERRQSSEGS
jgi:hypothetical protein